MTAIAHRHHPEQTEATSTPTDTRALALIAAHNGDTVAALRSVMADVLFLETQLAGASALMSRGMGRGWMPAFTRLPDAAPEA
jgi:hypothetical protein